MNPQPCYDYIFDDRITLAQKVFITRCMETLESYDKISTKELNRKLNHSDGSNTQTSQALTRIKSALGMDIFQVMQTTKPILLEPSHDKYPVIETEFGFKISQTKNSDGVKLCCGEESLSEFSQSAYNICKKCSAAKIRESQLKDPIKHLLRKVKKGTKSRGRIIDLSITEEDILNQYNKQNGLDYYTNLPFEDLLEMSIDRLDSSKGYEVGNIVITRSVINVMKNDYSVEQFKQLIREVYSNINAF